MSSASPSTVPISRDHQDGVRQFDLLILEYEPALYHPENGQNHGKKTHAPDDDLLIAGLQLPSEDRTDATGHDHRQHIDYHAQCFHITSFPLRSVQLLYYTILSFGKQ